MKDKYKFHILNSDGIIFLAFSIDNYNDKLGHQFLDTINQLFTDKYTKEQIDRVSKDSMNETFNPVLKEEIDNFNNQYLRIYDYIPYNYKYLEPKPLDEYLDEHEFFSEERVIRRRRNRNRLIKAIIFTTIIVIIIALIIVYVVLWVVCKGPTLPHCIK